MSGIKDAFYGDDFAVYPAGPGFARNSATSRAAAESIRPHYTHQQQKIIDFLYSQGERGATYTEVCTGTQLSIPSVCGRMVELVQAKAVVKTTRTRPTPSGRQAGVYLHKDFQGEKR